MNPSRDQAERSVGDVWFQGVRFVVIDAPLMRAGRGRRHSEATTHLNLPSVGKSRKGSHSPIRKHPITDV